MAPLAARRFRKMVALGERVVAIELLVAAQAVEIRGVAPLGQGTNRLVQRLRERLPLFRTAEDFPVDLEPVVELVRALWPTCCSAWGMREPPSSRVQYRG